jgi:hypothetical protein
MQRVRSHPEAPSFGSSTRQAPGPGRIAFLGLLATCVALLALALPVAASAGPLVKAWAAGPIGPTSADINAQVNPQGSETVYWFEWGTEDCSANPCASVPPEHDASAGSGDVYRYVLRHLTGLQPETTYHFRVLATNATGTTEGPDREFTTAAPEAPCANAGLSGAGFLPDCRAWEMVSPPEKNGADVVPDSYKVWAAEIGEGVSYPALGGIGEVAGTSVDVQYVARREGGAGTSGWRSHAINPPGAVAPGLFPLFVGNLPTFEALTPDLGGGIYRSWKTLGGDPNVAGVSNLYRLRDLDSDEPQRQLLSGSTAPLDVQFPDSNLAAFQAASQDLGHVVFQSPYDLSGEGAYVGAPGILYEYADGAGLRAVGRIPSGAAAECDDLVGPPCEDAASAEAGIPSTMTFGSGRYSTGMISADGSRILFQTPAGADSGAIYMREDGVRTYQLNAFEKPTSDSPAPAKVWAMSRDGSRVFFTTSDGLVPADEDGGSGDLYMYEVGRPAGERLTLVSVDQVGDGIVSSLVGTSEDGRYVYFVAGGQLLPGEPSNAQGLYLWHDGAISYIGAFLDFNVAGLNTPRSGWSIVTSAKTSRVSPDGRRLLFMAMLDEGFAGRGGYPGYDHGTCGAFPCRELYLYSAESGRLQCVSCNPLAQAASADALTDVNPGVSAAATTQHLSHALSEDGGRVFFSTRESLVAADLNEGKFDAYSYDATTGALRLLSSGASTSDSYFMDASPDGRDVYFVTRERLAGWDVDGSYDLYDARAGGGLPEPVPAPAPCEGESCLPAAAGAPPAVSSASVAAGPGNPKRPCPKGRHRVRRGGKVRCVKNNKHRKHRKHNQQASQDRRAGR